MDKQIKKQFSCFSSNNLLILVKITIEFEILFCMYVIWSDQFNLLSIITPKNLVLLTLTKLFPQRCTLYQEICFNSGTMEHHIVSFLKVNILFV